MPKLWNDTVDNHRQAVRDATLDAAERLVELKGLASVTMSDLAKETGIGRATLYKYFPDLNVVLRAWHERHVTKHLRDLHGFVHGEGPVLDRLKRVLELHASTNFRRHGSEVAALLHSGTHVDQAMRHLHQAVAGMIKAGAAAGQLRSDVPPDELAVFSLSAVEGASKLSSKAAVERLVQMTMAALTD